MRGGFPRIQPIALLVAGPGVFICAERAGLRTEIIAQGPPGTAAAWRLSANAEGCDGGGQGGGCLAGDLPLGLVLAVGLLELAELVACLLGVLAGWREQQWLQAAEQVLPGLLGDLPSATPASRSPARVAAAAATGQRPGRGCRVLPHCVLPRPAHCQSES